MSALEIDPAKWLRDAEESLNNKYWGEANGELVWFMCHMHNGHPIPPGSKEKFEELQARLKAEGDLTEFLDTAEDFLQHGDLPVAENELLTYVELRNGGMKGADDTRYRKLSEQLHRMIKESGENLVEENT